jgi:exodeoxyribonuclease V gamma subunit
VQTLEAPDSALPVLRDLVGLYDEGRRTPLPLPIKTSYAWAAARDAGDDPEQAATYRWKNECEDKAIERVWGRGARLADLAGLDEYAQRLWIPLLRAERGWR